jgi:hypothetical protein
MPRQVVEYTPCELTDCWKPNKRKQFLYGTGINDLVRYLSEKYGIRPKSARDIVNDVFRYIQVEVLSGEEGVFTVPRFGKFFRALMRHGLSDGSVQESIVLRFRSAEKSSWFGRDDPEWVDPDEVEEEA